ncbi:MAG: glycoside hydrolase [Bacteroidota bacterium]
MKRKITTTVALVLSFMVCLAFALSDLNSKWTGSLKTPDGNEIPLSFTFKVDGDKLSGTGTGPNGEIPITDGKVKGADFTFNLNINGSDITHVCKYYSAGDSVSVNVDFNGGKMHA